MDNSLLGLGCLLNSILNSTWAAWHLWLSWLGTPVQLGIVGGRLLGIACSGQLGTTLGRLGLDVVQLGLSLLLACLLPLRCVGGHLGMPGIWSGQLGQWPGISLVQVGQF